MGKMKNHSLLLSGLISILIVSGCYYDVEEEIYPTLACDTTAVTYSGTIIPILENNCYSCHSAAANFGNITLEGYDKLNAYVDNNQFIGAIRHEAGFSPMPKNQPQLVECDLQKIEAWIADGAPDN